MAVEIIQDFAYGGFLLLIGYFLRSKIKLLQKLYIPASVIGGVVGLLLVHPDLLHLLRQHGGPRDAAARHRLLHAADRREV